MNDIGPDRLVRDIALEIPGAIRAFESHRLDYCCGGGRTLRDACSRAGAPVDVVIADVEAEARASRARGEASDAAGLSLEQLVDLISSRHHAFVWREEQRLPALAKKVARVHGATHHELARVEELVAALFADMRQHQLREEQVLFPHLVALSRADVTGQPVPAAPFASVQSPTRVLELEHDAVGALLEELRTRTDTYRPPADACGSWRGLYEGLDELERDLMHHVHIENDVLFPLAWAVEARLRSRA